MLLVPAAGATGTPTQCNGTATLGSTAAKGCFRRDSRLGPKTLPKPPTAIGTLTRGYRRFGRLTRRIFLHRFWKGTPKSGSWRYPADNGFAGPSFLIQIATGTLVDRFGSPFGTFLSPAGTPYAMRAIPPSNLDTYPAGTAYNYHVYRVASAFTVEAGAIAPWFGQRGGGVEFVTCYRDVPCSGPNAVNINYLLAHGDLVEVAPAQGFRLDAARFTIVGRWRGHLHQRGTAPFAVTARIRGLGRSARNTVHYTGIDRSGRWTYLGGRGRAYLFREVITSRRSSTCKGIGDVTLTRAGANRVRYVFRGGGIVSRGLLAHVR